MLDPNLFPPEIHYSLNEHFGTKKSCYLRQVRVKIIDDDFAVINSTLKDGKWSARVIILRANVERAELEAISDIIDVAQAILPDLEKDKLTKEHMLEVLRQFT